MDAQLSLTGKRWVLAPLHGRDRAPEADAPALIALLRESRGLHAVPHTDTSWHNPGLFPDAGKAAARVHTAIENQEGIGIFGDYDCDGVTAAAQILRALRRRSVEPHVRLPHRVHDGYGLKPEHVDDFAQAGVTLLITVDTGISAHPAIDRAHEHGMDVIILDHHHLLTPPSAYAILHPALAPQFPHPHPSAAGVAFMFVHALEDGQWKDRDTDMVLATMGTIADLVMLRGFNRTLVQEGLRALPQLPHGPLRTFIDMATGGKACTSMDIAFRLAPRINAAGRMADPMLALRALLEGGELLHDLDTLNSLRQEQTARALERALLELTPQSDGSLPPFLAIASTSYPHGILGLLAGKLTERYGRPSMAVHIEGNLCTASLRSTPQYNIVQALERHSSMLLTYGGHAQAAGATFALEQYVALCDALEADARARIAEHDLIPTLALDAALPAHVITENFCSLLTQLEPFGNGNPEPLFLLQDVRLTHPRRVGADARHLQAYVQHCKVIGFGLGGLIEHAHQPLDIVCKVGMDTWNGKATPQLFVVDMRVAQDAASVRDQRSAFSTTQA